jgi:hypothetical protein
VDLEGVQAADHPVERWDAILIHLVGINAFSRGPSTEIPGQEVVDLENFPHSSVIKVPLAWI